MAEMILQAVDVSYSYDGENRALSGLNLSVRQGRRLALLGANGSGKTTLLLHLNGTLKPDSGVVKMNGESVRYGHSGLLALRQRVGLVFQDPDDQLFAATVRQDISFGPMNLGLPVDEIKARVDEALATLEITDLAERPPHMLSYGQKKLVAIAGVLAMRPDVIILDEPAAGLDSNASERLLLTLDRLYAKGVTLILATHDIDMAYAWADEVALMHDGAVVKQGLTEDVLGDADVLKQCRLRKPWALEVTQGFDLSEGIKHGGFVPKTQSGVLPYVRQLSARAVLWGKPDSVPADRTKDRTAILLVAFGSKMPETRRTFSAIEEEVCRSFPEHDVFWAFTSKTVLKHHKENGSLMLSSQEALDGLNRMGYKSVIIQSLHIMPGEEYKRLLALELHGMKVVVGAPLLGSDDDIKEVYRVLKTILRSDRPNVVAGHGNANHPELNEPILKLAALLESERNAVVMASIDGPPGTGSFGRITDSVARCGAVHFVPLMLVSGIHVADDIMGDGEGAWKKLLLAKETSVAPSMGELPGIRAILIRHIREVKNGR